MTREEAIKILKAISVYECYPKSASEETKKALDMAIEALHREEAEEKGYCHRIIPRNVEVVVRCKDCKYKCLYDYDDDEPEYYYCALEDRPNRNWSVDDTDFCSWGERRDSNE